MDLTTTDKSTKTQIINFIDRALLLVVAATLVAILYLKEPLIGILPGWVLDVFLGMATIYFLISLVNFIQYMRLEILEGGENDER